MKAGRQWVRELLRREYQAKRLQPLYPLTLALYASVGVVLLFVSFNPFDWFSLIARPWQQWVLRFSGLGFILYGVLEDIRASLTLRTASRTAAAHVYESTRPLVSSIKVFAEQQEGYKRLLNKSEEDAQAWALERPFEVYDQFRTEHEQWKRLRASEHFEEAYVEAVSRLPHLVDPTVEVPVLGYSPDVFGHNAASVPRFQAIWQKRLDLYDWLRNDTTREQRAKAAIARDWQIYQAEAKTKEDRETLITRLEGRVRELRAEVLPARNDMDA